jgi:DNA mismatch endonuclease (patch repair protein)
VEGLLIMDTVSRAVRSRMMAGIRSRNTRPEKVVRSLLHRLGYRFRLHAKELPGRPDIFLPKHRKVIFVNGCYWHGHTCRIARLPQSRLDYWLPKIQKTQARDLEAVHQLVDIGWRSLTIWECETRRHLGLLESKLREFIHT